MTAEDKPSSARPHLDSNRPKASSPTPQSRSCSTSLLTISSSCCSTGTARSGMNEYVAVERTSSARSSNMASASSQGTSSSE